MRQRSIYLSDEIWRLVKIEAASRGTTSSQVVSSALEAHLHPKPAKAEAILPPVGSMDPVTHVVQPPRAFTPVPKPTSSKRKA